MSLAVQLRHGGPPLDLHLDVPEGTITALVGPSGSGKTAILRAVAGVWHPLNGRISLGADTWLDTTLGVRALPRDRSIGLVPQRYALFPHLTARGNVEASLLHVPAAARAGKAVAALERAHVGGLDGRYPHELSGGQQQRVAVARAIAREPRVLLLDEPFSSVDRSTRKHLYAELKRLHAQLACTVLLVTHDLDEAAMLASHVCLIRRGRLLQAGPTQDVLVRPRSAAAARLLDYTNIFAATIARHDRGARTTWLDWHGNLLAAPLDERLPEGRSVEWAIGHGAVILRDGGDAAAPAGSNLVRARVRDAITLGDDAHVRLAPEANPSLTLHMKLPRHQAEGASLSEHASVAVSLTASAIVLLEESEGLAHGPHGAD